LQTTPSWGANTDFFQADINNPISTMGDPRMNFVIKTFWQLKSMSSYMTAEQIETLEKIPIVFANPQNFNINNFLQKFSIENFVREHIKFYKSLWTKTKI